MWTLLVLFVPPIPTVLFFIRAKNSVDCSTTDGTLALEGGFAIFHGDALSVFQFCFFLAFDAIV
jgi:hypothetical protein